MKTVLVPGVPWPTNPHNPSAKDWVVLEIIREHKGISATKLAKAKGVTYQAIKHSIRRLREGGWIDSRIEKVHGIPAQAFYFSRD